jgi:hypothetical protein
MAVSQLRSAIEVFVALVDQAKSIILTPATEWPVIASSPPVPPATLYTSYIIPLALIPPVCSLISSLLFVHYGFVIAIVIAAMSFILELVSVFVVALIAQTLAPSFNGIADQDKALKWIAYANTPKWIAGVALLIPVLGFLVSLIGSLYSLYVLYLGTVPMMKVPQEKAIGYVVVVILVAIVISVLIGVLGGIIGAGAMFSSGAYHRY